MPLLIAAAAGASTVFAFAPFAVSGIALATLAVLFWQWQRAGSAREAARVGFAFGAGLFGAGASWLYIAIVSFGGMPPWLASISIAILVGYLALGPALAGYVAARLAPPASISRLVIAAGAFTLAGSALEPQVSQLLTNLVTHLTATASSVQGAASIEP